MVRPVLFDTPTMMTFANGDTIVTLPLQTTSLALAAACREAAMSFMHESRYWGKAELALWLLGPYGELTQYTSRTHRARESALAFRSGAPLRRDVAAGEVDGVLTSAREEVTARLARHIDGGADERFAFEQLELGHVVRCADERGVVGWAPSPSARRLADRVGSLFAADYLVRPADHHMLLNVCRVCEMVDFDAASRVRGACFRHVSGVFSPPRVTLPYLPGGV